MLRRESHTMEEDRTPQGHNSVLQWPLNAKRSPTTTSSPANTLQHDKCPDILKEEEHPIPMKRHCEDRTIKSESALTKDSSWETMQHDIPLLTWKGQNILPIKEEYSSNIEGITTESKGFEQKASGIQCTMCDMKYENIIDYTNHLKIHSGDSSDTKPVPDYNNTELANISFSCPTCNLVFQSETLFNGHMKMHEKAVNIPDPRTLTFKCNVCNVTYGTIAGVKSHMKMHKDPSKYSMHIHNSEHQKRTRFSILYKCKRCKIVCTSMAGLKIHLKTHNITFSSIKEPAKSVNPTLPLRNTTHLKPKLLREKFWIAYDVRDVSYKQEDDQELLLREEYKAVWDILPLWLIRCTERLVEEMGAILIGKCWDYLWKSMTKVWPEYEEAFTALRPYYIQALIDTWKDDEPRGVMDSETYTQLQSQCVQKDNLYPLQVKIQGRVHDLMCQYVDSTDYKKLPAVEQKQYSLTSHVVEHVRNPNLEIELPKSYVRHLIQGNAQRENREPNFETETLQFQVSYIVTGKEPWLAKEQGFIYEPASLPSYHKRDLPASSVTFYQRGTVMSLCGKPKKQQPIVVQTWTDIDGDQWIRELAFEHNSSAVKKVYYYVPRKRWQSQFEDKFLQVNSVRSFPHVQQFMKASKELQTFIDEAKKFMEFSTQVKITPKDPRGLYDSPHYKVDLHDGSLKRTRYQVPE